MHQCTGDGGTTKCSLQDDEGFRLELRRSDTSSREEESGLGSILFMLRLHWLIAPVALRHLVKPTALGSTQLYKFRRGIRDLRQFRLKRSIEVIQSGLRNAIDAAT